MGLCVNCQKKKLRLKKLGYVSMLPISQKERNVAQFKESPPRTPRIQERMFIDRNSSLCEIFSSMTIGSGISEFLSR